MNKWKAFLAMWILMALSCSGVIDETQTELGGITGTTVTTNNLTKKMATVGEDHKSKVYLARSSDTVQIIDSVEVMEGESFTFDSLPAGFYDIYAEGELGGGSKRKVEVKPSTLTQITIQLNVYIVQNFITQNITNIIVVSGAADVESSNGLSLKLLEGDTLPVVLSFVQNGTSVTRTYWVTIDSQGNPVILSSRNEVKDDLPEMDSTLPFENANIVVKYVFDEKPENAFKDQSGNDLHGVIKDSTGISYASTGIVLQGMESAYSLSMPSLDSVMDYDVFAIRAVVKPSSWPYYIEGAICGSTHWNYGIETYGYELRINKAGYVEFVVGMAENYNWTVLTSKEALQLDEWSVITAVYDHGTMKLYVSGQEISMKTGIPAVNNHSLPLDIGYRSVATPRNQFAGIIHSIEVFQDSTSSQSNLIDTIVPKPDTIDMDTVISNTHIIDLQFSDLQSDSIWNDGTVSFSGGITRDDLLSRSDSGLVFNKGTVGSVVFPSMDSYVDWTNFEVSVKFMAFSITGVEQCILNNVNITSRKGIEIRIEPNGRLRGIIGDGLNWRIIESSAALSMNQWYVVKMKYSDGLLSVYLNDELVGNISGISAVPVASQPLNVGYRWTSTPRNPFHGVIQSIQVD